VWLYDESISGEMAMSTWNATDTTVAEPLILYNFFWSAIFPNATSFPGDRRKKRAISDIWDDGTYITEPWSDVSVSVSQEACPGDQNFTAIAIDANGITIASVNGINQVGFTIPEDTAYPVTVTVSANVGKSTTVISNLLPIKFALGDADNGMCFQTLFKT